jgi:tetratricopeptide (TPR) repeat protein
MKPSKKVQRAIDEALKVHMTGDLDAAMAVYRKALRKEPNHFDALHLLGVALRQQGRVEEGLVLIERALKVRQDIPEGYNNLGDTLAALGREAEAEAAYRRALELRPSFVEAQTNLAALLKKQGRLNEAIAAFEAALAINPANAEAISNLGLAQAAAGDREGALATYRDAIARDPNLAEAHSNLGLALKGLNRYDEAEAAFRTAIALKPRLFDAHNNLGSTLIDVRRYAEAEATLRVAMDIDPSNLAGLNNLGIALMRQGKIREAIDAFERVTAADPDYADAHSNCGVAWIEELQLDKAIASYRRAQAARPDFPEAYWNESIAHLMAGDFEQGWRLYEWRWKSDRFPSPRRDFDKPLWLGNVDPRGKTILLHAEQGLGDTIQFLRYVPLVAAIGGDVVFECPTALCGLVRALQLPIRIVPAGAPLPPFDMHCPLLSLPLAFDTRVETIPVVAAYLFADQLRAGMWKHKLGPARGTRVGLVWSGNPKHGKDYERSLAFEDIRPILDVPGVEFVSLQKEVRPRDAAALAASPVRDTAAEIADFSDTAALVANVDLVISVDTSVAHLAGAMGKPVWVLNAFMPDWRWMLDRADSPWYPSARIYRQPVRGDWASVIAEIARDLASLATAKAA